MTAATLGGALVALGLWLAWAAAHPAPEPLSRALTRLRNGSLQVRGEASSLSSVGEPPAATRFGTWLVGRRPITLAVQRVDQDLRLLGRSPEEHAAAMVTYALVGLLWAPTVTAGGWLMGIGIPVAVPVWLSLGGCALATILPQRSLRSDAARARAAFRHALSAFCDVAGLCMAAGREVYAALFEAARAGHGPAFAEIRRALEVGFVAGDKPWVSLRTLGEHLGIDDLVELAATIALAGDEGAAVRDTLAARARSIRERLTTDAEKHAAAATERMAIPGAMLLIGFLWFLAFPALSLMLQQSR